MFAILSRVVCGPDRASSAVVARSAGDAARRRLARCFMVVGGPGALLLLSLTLTACGGGGEGGKAQSAGPLVGDAPREGGSSASSRASAGGQASAAGAASRQVEGGERGDGASLPDFDEAKVVKTAELGIRSKDVRESLTTAGEVAGRLGGSVASSRVSGEGGSVTAEIVLSIPSPEFEAALGDLRGMGEVTTDTVGGEDVTEEFVDLRSRERNLLAAEESLLRLYNEAESVDDALSVERELTDLRGQIEMVQGRIQYLEDRTATSRISVDVRPVGRPPGSAFEPVRTVSTAWNASLDLLGAAAGVLVSAVVFGWWFLPVAVVATLWWRRRARASSATEDP